MGVALLYFGIGELDSKIHTEKQIETAKKTRKKEYYEGTRLPDIQHTAAEADN